MKSEPVAEPGTSESLQSSTVMFPSPKIKKAGAVSGGFERRSLARLATQLLSLNLSVILERELPKQGRSPDGLGRKRVPG